jgi:hypothetical protein
MSVSRRVHQTELTGTQPESLSAQPTSTILATVEAPVVRRLKAVMAELTTFAAKNSERKTRRYSFLLRHMSRAIIEELDDVPSEAMGEYFSQMGTVVSWIGTGDDTSLPPGVAEYLIARAGGLDQPLPDEDLKTPEGELHEAEPYSVIVGGTFTDTGRPGEVLAIESVVITE